VANGIVGTEIFIAGQTRDIVETIYEIGGEGQKFFHLKGIKGFKREWKGIKGH
jgi:hypothetical protein